MGSLIFFIVLFITMLYVNHKYLHNKTAFCIFTIALIFCLFILAFYLFKDTLTYHSMNYINNLFKKLIPIF